MRDAATAVEPQTPPSAARAAARRARRRAAILCDVDGTLAPIVDDPAAAGGAGARRASCCARSPSATRSSAASPAAAAAEARGSSGSTSSSTSATTASSGSMPGRRRAASSIRALRGREDAPRAFLAERSTPTGSAAPGLRIEDKGPIQALHWRGAATRRAAEARAQEIAAEARGAPGCRPLGPQGARDPPAGRHRQGLGARRAARASGRSRTRSTAATTAPTSTRFRALRGMRGRGRPARPPSASGSPPTRRPPELARRRDVVVDGPEGFARGAGGCWLA